MFFSLALSSSAEACTTFWSSPGRGVIIPELDALREGFLLTILDLDFLVCTGLLLSWQGLHNQTVPLQVGFIGDGEIQSWQPCKQRKHHKAGSGEGVKLIEYSEPQSAQMVG